MDARTTVAMCLVLVALGVRAHSKCPSKESNRLSFTVTSRRNETGHRVVTAKVNNQSPLVQHDGGSNDVLTMDVAYDTKTCDGNEELDIVASLVVSPGKTRPTDYERYSDFGFYKLHLTPLTWEEARRKCILEGGHLAVINSKEEANVIADMFGKAPKTINNATYSHVAAVGFHDLDIEGHYTTIYGQTLNEAGYSEWAPSQPNNAASDPDADSDCGGVERNGKLNDIPCSSRNAFFCEQAL